MKPTPREVTMTMQKWMSSNPISCARGRMIGDKISMSAHMVASNLNSGLGPGYKWATQAVLEALSGKVPNNVFNPEVIEKWNERFGNRKALPSNQELEEHPGFGPIDP